MNILLSPLLGITKLVEDTLDTVRQVTEKIRTGDNPYLSDNFKPVTQQVSNLPLRTVFGQLPADLQGVYLRNGPNPVYNSKGLYHWFDGDGMIHAVRIRGSSSTATYSNHQIQTRKLAYETTKGEADWLGVGDMKGPLGLLKMGLFQARMLLGDTALHHILSQPPDGVANTSVKYHAGKLLAISEMYYPTALSIQEDTGTVATVGTYFFNDKLQHHWTAHPKTCPVTGEMMSFCYNIAPTKPTLNYTLVNPEGVLTSTIDIELPHPIMMHDFSITTHYSIFLDLPLQFDPSNMAKRLDGGAFVYKNKKAARFGVLPRHAASSDEMVWFSVQACAIFHVINSYETRDSVSGDEKIIVQACRFTDIDLSNIDKTKEELKHYNELWMYQLNVTTGQVEIEEPLVARPRSAPDVTYIGGDFPAMNPAVVGRPHTYCYISRFSPEHNTKFDGIVKINCATRAVVGTLVYGGLKRGGEVVFVAKDNGCREDDGYLVGYVHDENTNVSEFYVVDASTMCTVCICELPKRVPFGMHGTFLSEKELKAASGNSWRERSRL